MCPCAITNQSLKLTQHIFTRLYILTVPDIIQLTTVSELDQLYLYFNDAILSKFGIRLAYSPPGAPDQVHR